MINRLIILTLCFCNSILIFSQNTNLCAGLIDFIKIENTSDIPEVIENNENGTLSLNFNQQYLTDIFANYTIYDFYQSFPNGSEVTQKIYTIAYSSRQLINDINNQIPSNIIEVDFTYPTTPLQNSFIDFLNGKEFRYSKYCSDVPEVFQQCSDNEVVLSNDFDFIVSFSYDSVDDFLIMRSEGFTPCNNAFSIGFKGGEDSNNIQVWEIELVNIAENSSCDNAETFFNNLFNIGCFPESHYGDIYISTYPEDNKIVFGRNTLIFSSDYVTLDFHALSLKENHFENIKLISNKNHPYINFTNLNDSSFEIEMFNTSGKNILNKQQFTNDTFSINSLSNGLYFINLYRGSNQKVFKFLKTDK